jgi:hypothetical protein
VLAELESYKSALTIMFAKYNATPIFFEISRGGFVGRSHAHIQCVPVPKAKQQEVEAAFKAYGGMQMGWEKDPEAALRTIDEGQVHGYFKVDLPGGGKMVHLMKHGKPFNLQFGRWVSFCLPRVLSPNAASIITFDQGGVGTSTRS